MKPERILVALQGSDSDVSPLQAACALAPLYDADLRGLFVEPDPAAYMLWTGPGAAGASVVSSAIDTVREEAAKACEEAQKRFDAAIKEHGLDDAAPRLDAFAQLIRLDAVPALVAHASAHGW